MDTKKLRQKILDLAIRGKLVPQDPNDEPASVLLERIRAEKERLVKEGKIKKSKASKTSDTPHYEQVPFEVPSSWVWCKLEDIAYVASGSTPSKDSFVAHGVPYIKMYNLRNQKIDFDYQPQYIKEEVHNGKLQRSRTEIGDLIMNIVGPPLGKLAIIPHSLPQANFNQAAVLIRPLQYKEVLVKYLFYYLSEMTEINSISTKGSAGQVNISLTQSQNMRIPFPPLAEQKRIVAEIERWFVLVDQIDKGKVDLQTTIKQTKSKILDLAIHGKLVPQDPNDEPASELLKRINPRAEITCDNGHYEKLLNNWVEIPIDVFCDMYQPQTISTAELVSNGQYPVYGANGIIGRYDLYNHSESEILLTCRGATCGSINISEPFSWINGNAMVMHIKESFVGIIDKTFFAYFLKSINKDNLITGSAQPQITQVSLKKIHISIPPLSEQQRIVDAIDKAFEKLDTIMESL